MKQVQALGSNQASLQQKVVFDRNDVLFSDATLNDLNNIWQTTKLKDN